MKNFLKKTPYLSVVLVLVVIFTVLVGSVFYSRKHGNDYKFNQDNSLKEQYKDKNINNSKVIDFEIVKEDEIIYVALKDEVRRMVKLRLHDWNGSVTIDFSNESKTALKGKWEYGDHWDWIAYKTLEINPKWVVLVSFDGFDCSQVDKIPTTYSKFFEEKIYMFDMYNKVNRYCLATK